jgi:hypothetical protein
MTWRIHLPHPIIRRIDLLAGEKTVVAVWTQPDRVHYYDQRNGSLLGERVVEKLAFTERQDDRWRIFLNGLVAPNAVFLPFVRAQGLAIYVTSDGRVRLLQSSDKLFLELGGKEAPLHVEKDSPLVALDMDRQSGAVVGVDSTGKLHVFQQRLYAGIYDLGLQVEPDMPLRLLVTDGAKRTYITDGQSLLMIDEMGKVRKRVELHYSPGSWAASPDGKLVAISDVEIGVIRLYDGVTLMPTHQRFAIDLAADARRLNPAAGTQPPTISPSVLSLTSRGVIAFALGALLCVTSATKMRPIPQSQT